MSFFEGLQQKFDNILKKLRSTGRVTEKDISEISREIKIALLEADVNYKVVKSFIETIKEKAQGANILESLTPGQQIIKIVNDELVSLLGGSSTKLTVSSSQPSIYVLVGLQGSGKTTSCAKLANLLRKQGKKPLLAACDVYRPAAVQQLQVLGKQLDIEVYAEENSKDVVKIAKNAIDQSYKKLYDTVIIDTAGRLQIDELLMKEIKDIKTKIKPTEILLVVDSMSGQDALNVARTFNEQVGIDGIIMTKLDGDTRGGAALSAKAVTDKPIKFACVGEKLSDIEIFYPERIASRILGMGDILSLVEKAQENFDLKNTKELEERLRKQTFTLDDFLSQLQEVKKMGSISQIMGMIPGMKPRAGEQNEIDDAQIKKIEAVIRSMTMKERINPSLLNASRRKRIASGSGTNVQAVNKVVADFENMKKMIKMVTSNKKLSQKFGKVNFPV
jgi:signal recognition particle subunit SRP54